MSQDLVGKRYARWTVLRQHPERSGDRKTQWICLCDCGNQRTVRERTLLKGLSKSCGCRLANGSTHRLYRRWYNMVQRCTNPDFPDWRLYGARGIKVCDRWLEFDNFLSDMDRSFTQGGELDRKDNDGHYEPGNVRWATRVENATNRRLTVRVKSPWGEISLTEAARRSGLPYDTLLRRHHDGWPAEALFEPIDQGKIAFRYRASVDNKEV